MSFKSIFFLIIFCWFILIAFGAFKPDKVVDFNATLDWPTTAQIDS